MSALQPCPTCLSEDCCPDNPFTFSLVAGQVYANDQVAIDFQCPPGFRCIPGVYLIPKGQFTLVVPSNEASTLRMQCCQNEIVQQIPQGATAAEIGVIAQNMVNACALQQAQCNARSFISYRNTYRSKEACYNGCGNQGDPNLKIGWIGSPPNLPPAIFFQDGSLCLKEDTFVGQVSQRATDDAATKFLQDYVTTLLFTGVLDCGYWNEEQTCPNTDPPVVIPAYTVFSTVSQEDANTQALAQGCPQDCFADLANPAVTGIFGTSVVRGRGAFADKMYAALGTGGIAQIDAATNTVDWEFAFPAQIHVLAVRDNGLLYAIGDADWYIFDPAFGGSITYSDVYPSSITLGYYSCTPWNPNGGGGGGSVCVVCYGDTGGGNKYHIVELPLGAPSVVFSASGGFDIISSPGSYDPGRDQYNFKIRDSTLYPGTPERIVTFNSSFTIINSVAMNTIFNGDGLFYVDASDTLYYYGRNTLGDGLYPVDPVSLVFGAQIVALGGFPSGQFAYDSTNEILGVVHNSYIPLVDVNTNTIVCDGTVLSSNDNGFAFYPPDTTLYVKTDIPTVAVRQSAT